MSARTDIKDALETMLSGVEGTETTSQKFRPFDEVDEGEMPYYQIISSDTERERYEATNRTTRCIWELDLWGYFPHEEDVETYYELIRLALKTNRGLSVASVEDAFIVRVVTDDNGVFAPKGFLIATIEVTYRVDD